ncbi:MAG TPA: hypothetical protein VG873_09850 [Burkholderiales bacterium]|nr:hypothetical protein [Burkholderiales bacterium]
MLLSLRLLSLAFVLAAGTLHAQERGTVPPGTAPDGSRPADGAIKGGTILPGERGGMPENAPSPERRVARCNELSGTLRDDCLRRERDASSGSSGPDLYGPKSTPPSVPPPQNPK